MKSTVLIRCRRSTKEQKHVGRTQSAFLKIFLSWQSNGTLEQKQKAKKWGHAAATYASATSQRAALLWRPPSCHPTPLPLPNCLFDKHAEITHQQKSSAWDVLAFCTQRRFCSKYDANSEEACRASALPETFYRKVKISGIDWWGAS